MNIIKLQDQLKGLPDQLLAGYVQNPTGEVPTYLALSELQRRKTMREKYQKEQAPATTVAEDLAAPPAPAQGLASIAPDQMPPQMMAQAPQMPQAPVEMAEGGLAELDVGDMYDEANFASGGIVAFADGGDTSTPWYRKMKLFGREFDPLPPSPNTIRSLQSTTSSNPFMGGMAGMDSDPMVLLYKLKELHAKPNKTLDEWNQISEIEKKIKGGDQRGGYTPVEPPAISAPDASIKKEIEETKYNPFADKAASSDAMVPVEKIDSLKNYADEFKDYLGVDPMRAKLTERLNRMDASVAKQTEQAPWMALAQAGFSMASGRSPFALQNIAAGGTEGVKSYAETMDRLNTLEDRRFLLENSMAKAMRDEQIAAAKYGADSKQAAQARSQAERLHNSTIKNQYKIAELNASINSTYRMSAVKDKLDDNVRAKIKQVYGEGSLSPEEYDKHYKRFLAEEYAKYGLSGAPAITESMPGNMVFDPKTKEYTYKTTK